MNLDPPAGTRVEITSARPAAGPRCIAELQEGLIVASLTVTGTLHDARGQAVPPGDYRLVTILQPALKAHLDTSECPEFALLVPKSFTLEGAFTREKLASGASNAADARHPLVLRLEQCKSEKNCLTVNEVDFAISF